MQDSLTIQFDDRRKTYHLESYIAGGYQKMEVREEDPDYFRVMQAFKLRDLIPIGDEARIRLETEKEKKRNEILEKEKTNLKLELEKTKGIINKIITGNPKIEAHNDLIKLYAEWHEGLSIDSGDIYRVEKTLYVAKKAHISSPENSPTSEKGSTYWLGGKNVTEQPEPSTEFKYPKGTIVEYMGVLYKSTVDTNDDPSVGYPTWDLAENANEKEG